MAGIRSEINDFLGNPGQLSRRKRWRVLQDRAARGVIALGGISVVIAVLLIFVYLLYVVFPLFLPSHLSLATSYSIPGGSFPRTLALALNEQATVASRLSVGGELTFFEVNTGEPLGRAAVEVPSGARITTLAEGKSGAGLYALGLSDGRAVVVRQAFDSLGFAHESPVTDGLHYPLGRGALVLDAAGAALKGLALSDDANTLTLSAITEDHRVVLSRWTRDASVPNREGWAQGVTASIPAMPGEPKFVALGEQGKRLYIVNDQSILSIFDIAEMEALRLVDRHSLVGSDSHRVTAVTTLMGEVSVLFGFASGRIEQWFVVRDTDSAFRLALVRAFRLGEVPVVALKSESQTKGFVAVDQSGRIGIFHTTADRILFRAKVAAGSIVALGVAPRTDKLLVQDAIDRLTVWHLRHHHPEVSLSALWNEVWYENYDRPELIWQSSPADRDVEPKYSLTPLVFGTLKAALAAMVFALPLAVMGAVYTAYFMAPALRRLVKPTVEVIEALPTVILGFIAAVWLAPLVETHLAGVFALVVIVPLGILSLAFAWRWLPERLTKRLPQGWEVVWLIPVVLSLGWLSFALSASLESSLFGGNLRAWLNNELGLSYEQRNAVVVGCALGFAIIPTMFSISEDAISAVPGDMSYGSAALGATPWQTLVRVVLPMASPALFVAVVFGFARAAGETMIVLMVTGNTPTIDFNFFEGMRTLAANIAIEMPESAVGTTHYRVLFLSALVLLLFTFGLNTVAELARQHFRKKYAAR